MKDILNTVEPKPHRAGLGGTQRRYTFANGYGASIVTGHMFTNGADYELAVFGPDGELDYTTPVTNDVERGDADRMNELLALIEALPAVKP